MTAALAIAATSEVLRYIIEDALVRAGQALNFTPPPATIGPPPRTAPSNGQGGTSEAASINLFLHHVTPNPAWRNLHSPERDRQGRRLNNAPLVLDLHYLLSAHGGEIDREIGFGTAMHALHQVAIVPAELIRLALKALINQPNALRKILAGEALADQIERLTVTPQTLDIDAVTKIWTAAQVPYRPSIGYLVTTVFLEDMKPSRAPLPIGASGVDVAPMARIAIDSVAGVKNGKRVAIVSGVQLVVEGEGLAGPGLSATLDGVELVPDGEKSSPGKIVLTLPADIAVGVHYLEIAKLATAGSHTARIGAASASVTVLPAIANPVANVTPDGSPNLRKGTVTVDVTPAVRRTERVSLRLTDIQSGAEIESFWTPPAQPPVDTFSKLQFKLAAVPAGTYIVRVSVRGLASPPEAAQNGALGPRVTL